VYNQKMIKTRWSVKIPTDSILAVKQGEVVKKGQVLVRIAEEGEVKKYDLSIVLSKLSSQSLEKVKSELIGREVKEGEELLGSGGWFPKKVYAPLSGTIDGIDDYHCLSIKIGGKEGREVISPVEAKVNRIEKDKVVLEFSCEEYKGKGVIPGKVWGNLSGKVVETLVGLSYLDDKKIVLIPKLDFTVLLKAEVVGAVGIVTQLSKELDKFDRMDFEFPMIALDAKNWQELEERLRKGGEANVLLNSLMDRLLVVNSKSEKN